MSAPAQTYHTKVLQGHFDLFAMVKANPERYPFLLESTAKATQQSSAVSRFDILFACPCKTLLKKTDGFVYIDDIKQGSEEFLDELDRLWAENKVDTGEQDLYPFHGGWFIFASYELVDEIEPTLNIPKPNNSLPVAMAVRIPVAVIYDHQSDQTIIFAEPGYYDEIETTESDIRSCNAVKQMPVQQAIMVVEDDDVIYLESIRHIKKYIRDGDVFQVNLSRLWQGELLDQKADMLYESLRINNPAPFSGYIHFNNGALLSSSPERLVAVRQGKIETRPIAGTRPRGENTAADTILQTELIQHPKERAEHVMLIDLERNDLGRICKPGTVRVDEKMIVESYAHVHHIVSNITGELRANVTPGDVIRAVFPGGTITGCPKVRCMEIIAEHENTPRGAYTGSIGYIGHEGNMDLNILIRSIVIENNTISFRAGAGLVADSIPEKELDETRAKAKGLLLALNGGAGSV